MKALFSLIIFLFSLSAFAEGKPGQLSEFQKLGIRHVIYKNTTARLQKLTHPEDTYYLDIQFGRLTQAKFNALKKFFSNRSYVPFNSVRSYDLIDFLDPAIQAVVNHVYLPKSYSFQLDEKLEDDSGMVYALNKNGIESFANCWSTTMQVLRLRSEEKTSNSYYFYWPDRWTATESLKDNAVSKVVDEKDVQPGDVLVVSTKSGLQDIQHSAIVLTRQLVFEKTDSSENDPYRIALRSDVLKKYKRLLEEDGEIEYRRFDLEGSSELFPLPTIPSDIFGKNILAAIQKVHPTLKVNQIVGGCETGLGGGCDPTHNEIETSEVRLNKKTGRGVISGNKPLLERLIPLN